MSMRGKTIRIPNDLREGIAEWAVRERRSFSGMVVYILWDWLRARDEAKEPEHIEAAE